MKQAFVGVAARRPPTETQILCSLTLATVLAGFLMASLAPLAAAKKRPRMELVVRVLGCDLCPGRVTNLVQLDCSVHQDHRRNVALDCGGLVDRPAKYFTQLKVNITKCSDGFSYNTCEYVQTLSYSTAVCTIMLAPGMPWTNISHNVVPPLKCPFAAGPYRMDNGYIDMKSVPLLPIGLEKNKWLFELQLFDERPAMHLCFRAAADFVYMRVLPPE